MVYLPLLFVDELSNRVKDLVVSFAFKHCYVMQQFPSGTFSIHYFILLFISLLEENAANIYSKAQ